ncbi:MAG TPA: LEPR-XLL domain-containing protein, partial [Burkholderiales bacterium]|nr:LEPR-XLL domain-containing protein [Burkholderiales bacterium]
MSNIRRESRTPATRHRIPTLSELFWSPLAKGIRRIRLWRKRGLLGKGQAEYRRAMRFEPLEPRLLLSADLHAGATWGTALSLTAADPTHLQLSDGSNNVSALLDSSGIVNISRTATGDVLGDTVQLDLASLAGLDLSSLGSNALDIKFTGGSQTLAQDKVQLTSSGSFDHDFKVESDSAIEVATGASLTASGHDVTLAVSQTDSGLPPISSNKFYASATAASISVQGDLSAHDISLTSDATIDVDNASLSLGALRLAFIYASSDATIDINGSSHVTATGKLDLLATSKVSATADMSSSGSSDSKTDAAVASVIVTSDSAARVAGDAELDVTGALTVSAKNTSLASAIADGSKGGAGATLGLALITGTTEASISGNATVTAGSMNLTAERTNDATALAKSTPAGATTPASQTDSQKALSDNKAGSSDGNIDLAGAVAVGTVVSHTQAFVDSSKLVDSTGTLDIEAHSVTSSQTFADGSSTVADSSADGGNGNIAIAVGIGVGDLHNDAYAGGTGGIQAGALTVKAIMASQDRKLDFATADIDASKGTIDLAGGAHGLKTGDAVVYHKPSGGKDITELTDGTTYYVAVQDDGKIKLSTNTDGSSPIGTLTVTGSGDDTFSLTFSDTDSRMGVTAIAGASGGSTSVAGALAINVGISESSAYIADGTTVTITGGGAVDVETENFIQVWSKSTGKQTDGTSTGVGPSFSLNIGETDTDAKLGTDATISGAGDITFSASSKNQMDNTAEGASKGKTAVTPVIAISIASNTTSAELGGLSSVGQLELDGGLKIHATHQGAVNTTATGDTESGSTGVGISLALSVTTDSATATTLRDVIAGGAIELKAKTTSGTKSIAKASSAGGDSNDSDKDASQGGVNKKAADNTDFASNRSKSGGGKAAGDTSGSSASAANE